MFMAGNLKHFAEEWKILTSDDIILSIVQGYRLEFNENIEPLQYSQPFQPVFNHKENEVIRNEIQNQVKMKIIEEISENLNGFYSPIFIRPKKSGGQSNIELERTQ